MLAKSHASKVISSLTPIISSELADKAHARQWELMKADECLLVDQEDRIIGTASKQACHLQKNIASSHTAQLQMLHRAFSLFVFDSKQQLLMQKRSQFKLTFPSLYSNTCCSHPLNTTEEKEETNALGVRRAALRKIEHELGVPRQQLTLDEVHYVSRILYHAMSPGGEWGEHELDYILVMQLNKTAEHWPVQPNQEEVTAVTWLMEKDLDSFVQFNPVTPWFLAIYRSGFLRTLWQNLQQLSVIQDHTTVNRLTCS